MAVRKRPTLAESSDRHALYEASVQCAETEIDFVDETFHRLRGRRARSLREEFCGTWITIDAVAQTLSVDVAEETLAHRRAEWVPPPYKATRGTLYKYIKNVKTASEGCVTDE
jgi:hypothetical protein